MHQCQAALFIEGQPSVKLRLTLGGPYFSSAGGPFRAPLGWGLGPRGSASRPDRLLCTLSRAWHPEAGSF